MFRVVIFGSRHYTDSVQFKQECSRILARKHPHIEIVEGDCKGPDRMAEAFAKEMGYQHTKFTPDWNGQGKKAAFLRNREMCDYTAAATEKGAICFWDGKSAGTRMMLGFVQKAGIPVKVIRIPEEVVKPPKPKRDRDAEAMDEMMSELLEGPASPLLKTRKGSKPIVIEGEELIAKPKTKSKRKPVAPGDNKWKIRYEEAHKEWFKREYPGTFKAGHYMECTYPRVRESNGMQTAIVNYLNWLGHRAKRINNMGRMAEGVDTTESGARITAKKWIPSAAGRGQADVSATINGRSCQLEVKAGNDKPSEYQLKEQAKERRAGGVYEFIHSIEQFYEWYDATFAQPKLFGST